MIEYSGKEDIKSKIYKIIDEMANDKELIYELAINESRINDVLRELKLEIVSIRDSMPNF